MTDPILAALSLAYLAVLALGLAVAARGLRGYRRTGSRLMLALGVAFALLSVKPVVAAVTGLLVDARTVGYVRVTSDVLLSGTAFALVLVALYAGRDRAEV